MLFFMIFSSIVAADNSKLSWPIDVLHSSVSYNQYWYQTSLGKHYLQAVYGEQYADVDANQITYFYPSFPFQALHIPFPQAAYYPQGVSLDQLWFPSFWPTQRDYPWVSDKTRAVRNILLGNHFADFRSSINEEM